MNWSNLNDFLAMGGYGLYVWGAFGVAALVMAGEMLSLRSRRLALRADSARPRGGEGRGMKPRSRRFVAIGAGLGALAISVALVLNAFNSNLVFFFSPSQIAANEAPRGHDFRLGGLVEKGSLHRASDSLAVQFTVTDLVQRIPVRYVGLLPDLFTEGKGVVAQGKLDTDGVFHANQVLAKHDENYMPPEAAAALANAANGGSMKAAR